MSPIPMLNIDQGLSLYIPVVENIVANFDYIQNIFHTLNIGLVKSVQFKPNECGYTMRAFIHFDNWYENICVSNLQERILSDEKEGRIVYDDPKYWILKKNTNPIPDNYAKQIEDIRQQNLKNYAYLLEYIQTLHSTINEQAKIMDKLNWRNSVDRMNMESLYHQVNNIKNNKYEQDILSRECKWSDEGRLRKRSIINYSES